MTFNEFNLDPRLMTGINASGFSTPTPIQQQALPVVLGGRDVLGLAQTGTGKTAAFVLPILQRLLNGPRGQARALILAPTRELAEQIRQDIKDLGRQTPLRATAIYGGVSKNRQIERLRKGVEIVVACPGRLLDHLGAGDIDLSQIEMLVLDEADRMCDMGFLPDIRRILRQLPSRRQTLFFSATMPDDIRQLSSEMLNKPVTIQIGHAAPAQTVSHALYPVPPHLKTQLITELLTHTDTNQVLVFTRTKHRARRLAQVLERNRFRTAALQGNMSQNRRQEAIDNFRQGKVDILVATDIAARGIDVSGISHVINFDMPATVDDYTHRIGRTGRAAETGTAYTFVTQDDEPLVHKIERVLRERIERRQLASFDYEVAVPERPNGSSRPGQGRTGGGRSHSPVTAAKPRSANGSSGRSRRANRR